MSFHYEGPVKMFDKVICNNFSADTKAVSEKKALNNLSFQAKRKFFLQPYAKIELSARYLEQM